MECIFCKIIRNNSQKLYQDERVTAFLDFDPITKGHILILPNEHFLDIDEIPDETLYRIFHLSKVYVQVLKDKFAPKGYSLMQNGGAFNDIGHFHLHVFPRFAPEDFGWTYGENVEVGATDFAFLNDLLQPQLGKYLEIPAKTPIPEFPVLTTNRLILNQLAFEDVPNIIKYAGNRKIADTTLNIPHPYEEKDAIYWVDSALQGFKEKTQFTFAIRLLPNHEFIGGIGLKVNTSFNRSELGYWVAEPFWNQGYTSEATQAILKYGFETLGLNKIYATHLIENPASGRVMIKNGMIKEGEMKEHTKKGDQYRSLMQFRLTREEYKQQIHK